MQVGTSHHSNSCGQTQGPRRVNNVVVEEAASTGVGESIEYIATYSADSELMRTQMRYIDVVKYSAESNK